MSPMTTATLKEYYQKLFLQLLDKLSGSKAIVWDNQLTAPVGFIADYNVLQEHDVRKMFALISSPQLGVEAACTADNLIYVVKSYSKDSIANVCEHLIKCERSRHTTCKFHVIAVPRVTVYMSNYLRLHVHNLSSMSDFEFCFAPMDDDFICGFDDNTLRESLIDKSVVPTWNCFKLIESVEQVYGRISSIYAYGELSQKLGNLIKRNDQTNEGVKLAGIIENLIIVDRSQDLVPVMLQDFTYEGLLDNTFGIQNMSVKIPRKLFAYDGNRHGSSTDEDSRIKLDTNDMLFSKMRYKHFSFVAEIVRKHTNSLMELNQEREGLKTIDAMEDFVKKIPYFQNMKRSISIHTVLAKAVKDSLQSSRFRVSVYDTKDILDAADSSRINPVIEQMIIDKEPLWKVLKLVCLQSLCCNGLADKVHNFYVREICQVYGIENLYLLDNLMTIGAIKRSPTASPLIKWPQAKHSTISIDTNYDSESSKVFDNMITPKTLFMIEQLGKGLIVDLQTRSSWIMIRNEKVTRTDDDDRSSLRTSVGSKTTVDKETTMVLYIGGVTYAELGVLRSLSSGNSNLDCIVAATGICHPKDLFDSMDSTD